MVDWPSYNRSLVRRGEILFSYDFLDSWGSEIEKMNKNKKGKPFIFPDSFILVIGTFVHHFICHTDKRLLLPANPSYGHICKRINRLTINIKKDKIDDDEYIIVSVDSAGIKVTNRGQWMNEKWNVQNKKGRLSQDPRSCRYKNKRNSCARNNS